MHSMQNMWQVPSEGLTYALPVSPMQNMWQVPSEEVNRPGSFSSHARRNLELLVHVLSELEETQSLLLLAQYLRTKPDVTKQYLRDNERVATHTKVLWYSHPPPSSLRLSPPPSFPLFYLPTYISYLPLSFSPSSLLTSICPSPLPYRW